MKAAENESNVSVTVKLDAIDSDRLTALAALKNQSLQVLLNEAVHNYLLKEEARQAFINEAKASWEGYVQTGQHITLNEFDAWVDTLQTKPDQPMPVCHKSY